MKKQKRTKEQPIIIGQQSSNEELVIEDMRSGFRVSLSSSIYPIDKLCELLLQLKERFFINDTKLTRTGSGVG